MVCVAPAVGFNVVAEFVNPSAEHRTFQFRDSEECIEMIRKFDGENIVWTSFVSLTYGQKTSFIQGAAGGDGHPLVVTRRDGAEAHRVRDGRIAGQENQS